MVRSGSTSPTTAQQAQTAIMALSFPSVGGAAYACCPGVGGRAEARPVLALLSFTPPVRCSMRPPRPALFVVLLHRDPMLAAPALGLGALGAGGWYHAREALQDGLQPGQQSPFVSVAERQLNLTSGQFEMDIDTRWGL